MPFKRRRRFSSALVLPLENSIIAAGREPSPSTCSMVEHSSCAEYFLSSSLISSSLVPGAMFPIQSFMSLPSTSSQYDLHELPEQLFRRNHRQQQRRDGQQGHHDELHHGAREMRAPQRLKQRSANDNGEILCSSEVAR